jgi:hypothetical protein
MKRPRLYSILVSKKKMILVASPCDIMTAIKAAMKTAIPEVPASACLMSSVSEVVALENALRQKKDRHNADLARPSDDWTYLLNDKQRQWLDGFLHKLTV